MKGNLVNAFENLLDGTHTHYVHAGLIRTDAYRQKVSAKLTAHRDHVEIEYSGESKQAGLISQLLERDRQTSYGRFFMPGIAQIEYRSSKRLSMLITAVARPVSSSSRMCTPSSPSSGGSSPISSSGWSFPPFSSWP